MADRCADTNDGRNAHPKDSRPASAVGGELPPAAPESVHDEIMRRLERLEKLVLNQGFRPDPSASTHS
jgi:hypothetical protein